MGYYVNVDSKKNNLPVKGKVVALINDGAKIVEPEPFVENLICVVDNNIFEAAAYCYSINERDAFLYDGTNRQKIWLTHPKAKELSGYK